MIPESPAIVQFDIPDMGKIPARDGRTPKKKREASATRVPQGSPSRTMPPFGDNLLGKSLTVQENGVRRKENE